MWWRLSAVLARLERRHWVALGASLALHLAVLFNLRQTPPPEPEAISFEIALETPKPAPAVKQPSKIGNKLARRPAKKPTQKIARQPDKRESHTLEAAWRGETAPGRDAPALALPAAATLGIEVGIEAPIEAAAKPGARPPLAVAGQAAAQPAAAAAVAAAGLSEPGTGALGAAATVTGQAGLALAASPMLAAGQAVNPGAAANGAQGVEAGTSQASGGGQGAGNLQASTADAAGRGHAAGNIAGSGAQVRNASAAPALAGGEPQGVRLTASGVLAALADSPAGSGSLGAGPQASEATRASPGDAVGAGAALADSRAGGAAASPMPAQASAGGRAGAGPAASFGQSAGQTADPSAGARGVVAAASLAATQAAVTALSTHPRAPTGAAPAMRGGQVLALAPGEAGSAPGLAVPLQPLLASLRPQYGNRAGAGTGFPAAGRTANAGGGADTGGAAGGGDASGAVRLARSGGGPAGSGSLTPSARADGNARGGMVSAAGALAVAGGGQEAAPGSAPAVLQATRMTAVQVVRPDSEIQRLDVLAPSTYCPLPGHVQPDNRPPKPVQAVVEQPAYAPENPGFSYPLRAWAYNHEGRVTVRLEVLPDGTPGKMWLKHSSGSGILDQDALAQLARWRFLPARRNGQAVIAWIDVPVEYHLKEAKP